MSIYTAFYQQLENYKQNVDVVPTHGKISADGHDHYSAVAFGNELITF